MVTNFAILFIIDEKLREQSDNLVGQSLCEQSEYSQAERDEVFKVENLNLLLPF